MKDEEINLIILNYFKNKGYTHSQQQFENEAAITSLPNLASQIKQDEGASVSNYILFHNAKNESLPGDYEKSYSQLKEWIFSSLHINRPELLTVLYPIFIHCYLDLIAKEFYNEAVLFMENNKKEHTDLHQDEINKLSAVKNIEQFKENEFSKGVRKQKQIVKISNFTFELLLSFLMESKLYLILAIVNQYIDIRVFVGNPNENSTQEYNPITSTEDGDINEKAVNWGLLPELVPNRDLQDHMDDIPDQPTKKRKLFDGIEFKTIESNIRLPNAETDAQIKHLKEIRNATPLSGNSLPSICCYTFLNTCNNLNTIELTQDSTIVSAGFSDSSIRIWDINKTHTRNFGTVIKKRNENGDITEERGNNDYEILRGHSGPIYGLSFSPDNNFLLSSSEDSTVRLWSMETKSNLVCYKGHNYPVWDVDFSPLGYYFATSSYDRTARIWSTDHIFPLRVLAGHLSDVDCVKFHPNCNYVATGSSDKSVRLWDVQKGECVRIFTGHVSTVYSLCFSPDGRFLASGGGDGTINIWDIGSGKKLSVLIGHKGPVWSLTFSQEGSILASGCADNTVNIWDTDKTKLLESVPQEKLVTPNRRTPQCPELLKSFPTKKTPIHYVKFSERNLLYAAGVYTPH